MLAEATQLQQQLLAAQNSDGGWPYQRGDSWTEPSALALIASYAYGLTGEPFERGLRWLTAQQRADGGWPPNRQVDISTSVTSLVTIALLPIPDFQSAAGKAAHWTMKQVYPDRLSAGLLLARMLRLPSAQAPGSVPWFPGTAGWVTPTSMSIIALSQVARVRDSSYLSTLVRESQSFLLSRRCVDGGWNHGGANIRSEDATSYPETTGIALLALSSLPNRQLTRPLALAERFLQTPESLEGLCWLQMGLRANGRSVSDVSSAQPPRTSRDIALRLLALASVDGRYSLMTGRA